jgi:hypothetical protein
MSAVQTTALSLSLTLSLALVACDGSSSSDRNLGRAELRATDESRAFWADYERTKAETWRRFAARHTGREQVGAGCDVCPHLCQVSDLRPLPVPAFQRQFRELATRQTRDLPYIELSVNGLELNRLACMVEGSGETSALRGALRALLSADEPQAVRFQAALHAVTLGVDVSRGMQVLAEIGAAGGPMAVAAQFQLYEWDAGPSPFPDPIDANH